MSIENFRCISGSGDHQRIKAGKLYRSGRLCEATKADIKMLAAHKIRHIVDLRSEEERQVDPYELPACFQVHEISALRTREGLENFYFFQLIDEHSNAETIRQAASFVHEGYQILPFHNRAFSLLLELMEKDDGAILFHCSSGKDRTGVFAALIQKLLGVKEADIWAGYLESNDYVMEYAVQNADRLGFQGEERDTVIYCCCVHEELLQSTWDAILTIYPDWPSFFEQEYQLNAARIQRLQQRYCERVG